MQGADEQAGIHGKALHLPANLFAVAFGSFLMALVSAWFAAEGPIVYLIYALSLYALAAAPGLVLMRRARRPA